MKPTRFHRRGFTLIELLTVIAIIGVLAAILIPTIGKVRESARTAQGLSNLRQIALATISYTNDNQSRLPPIYTADGSGDFRILLGAYMGSGNGVVTSDTPTFNAVFQDPSARIESASDAAHFTANTAAMGLSSANGGPRRITEYSNPARLILFFDGAQSRTSPAGGVELSGFNVANGTLNNVWFNTNPEWWPANTAIPMGPNTDTAESAGNIRWRAQSNTAAKFAFLDGHAAVLKPSEVTYGLFMRR